MSVKIRRRPAWFLRLLAFLGVLRIARLWSKWATTPNKPKLVDWRAGNEDREGFKRVEIWSRGLFRAPLRIETLADGTERKSVADEILIPDEFLRQRHGDRLPKKLRLEGITLKRVGDECSDYQLYRRSKLSAWLPGRPKLRDWLPNTERKAQERWREGRSTERNEVFGAADHEFKEQWGNELVQAAAAQKAVLQTKASKSSQHNETKVKIAVIDSGIDPTHREWGNYDSCIDKEKSKSFLSRVCCLCKKQPEYMDERHSHGTACSGLIAAKVVDPDDPQDLEGVALKPSLMVVKFLDADGLGTAYDACRSIHHAVDEGARILLLAWGGSSHSPIVLKALEYALKKNAVVVAAAGNRREKLAKHPRTPAIRNEGSETKDAVPERPFYPASYKLPNMLVVGATKREIVEVEKHGRKKQEIKEEIAPGSNYGPHVDLGAPGLLCKTTRRSHRGRHRAGNKGARYGYFSGTSAAAAYVAGACALVWLKLTPTGNSNDEPYEEPCYEDVIHAILEGADTDRELPFKCCRRLNAYKSVTVAGNNNGKVQRECPEDPCSDLEPYPGWIIKGPGQSQRPHDCHDSAHESEDG